MTVLLVCFTDLSDKQSETGDFWLEREKGREGKVWSGGGVFVFLWLDERVWSLRGGQLEQKWESHMSVLFLL